MHMHPPPPPGSSPQKCPKEERKVDKKNVYVPLRYDKIKTKKVGKRNISKRKGIKLKK